MKVFLKLFAHKECLRFLSFIFLFLPKRILLLIYRGIVLLKLIPIGKSPAKDNIIMYLSSFERFSNLIFLGILLLGAFTMTDLPTSTHNQPLPSYSRLHLEDAAFPLSSQTKTESRVAIQRSRNANIHHGHDATFYAIVLSDSIKIN